MPEVLEKLRTISTKTTAEALGVRLTKATQSRDPAIRKVARMMLYDAAGTQALLAIAMYHESQELIWDKASSGMTNASFQTPQGARA